MEIEQLHEDALLCVIRQVIRKSTFDEKLKLAHVNSRWRQLAMYAIAKEQTRLGLRCSSQPRCPERSHSIGPYDTIDNYFKKIVAIDEKLYRKIEGWKFHLLLLYCPNLQILSLSNSLVCCKILKSIHKITATSICHLDLSNCRGLAKKQLPFKLFFPRLRHLNLRLTDVTDSLASQLIVSSPQLTALSVSGDNITGKFISLLPCTITTLSFGGHNLNSDALDALECLPFCVCQNLKELKLIDIDNESLDTTIKSSILRSCVESFINLKSLVFKNCSLNSFNFPLLEIRKLHKLEVLRIDANVTEDIIFDDMAILNMIEEMPNLVYLQLDLVAWNLYTDPKYVFESLAKCCPKLKYLSIRKWISLKAQSLMYLSFLKSLVYLDIGQVSCFNKINLHGEVIELMTELAESSLRVLRLRTCFPDNDRFLAVLVIAEVLAKSRPIDSIFRLDLPLFSKEYNAVDTSQFSDNLVISNYDHYYSSVNTYFNEYPMVKQKINLAKEKGSANGAEDGVINKQ